MKQIYRHEFFNIMTACSWDTPQLIFSIRWLPSNLLSLFRNKAVAALFKNMQLWNRCMNNPNLILLYLFSLSFFLLSYLTIILRNIFYIIALSPKFSVNHIVRGLSSILINSKWMSVLATNSNTSSKTQA